MSHFEASTFFHDNRPRPRSLLVTHSRVRRLPAQGGRVLKAKPLRAAPPTLDAVIAALPQRPLLHGRRERGPDGDRSREWRNDHGQSSI